jgi:hypothetical protein
LYKTILATSTKFKPIIFIKLTFGDYHMGTSTILRSLTGKMFAVVLGLAVLSSTADAGMITGVQMFGTEAGTGPGMGTVSVPVILTVFQNNDNQAGGGPLDNNITIPVKRFDKTDVIDIVFQVAPTQGVTEYKVVEAISNNTTTNWSSYMMELGFGTGLGFSQSPAGDGLDFDAPLYDTPPVSSAFATVVPTEDLLLFTNGIHNVTGLETYQFRIDVPDLDVAGGPFTFTLRQIPVPEPTSYLLLLCALTCMWVYRKHRS